MCVPNQAVSKVPAAPVTLTLGSECVEAGGLGGRRRRASVGWQHHGGWAGRRANVNFVACTRALGVLENYFPIAANAFINGKDG